MSFILQLVKAYWPDFPKNELPGKRQNVSRFVFMDLLELECPGLRSSEWRTQWLLDGKLSSENATEAGLASVQHALRAVLGTQEMAAITYAEAAAVVEPEEKEPVKVPPTEFFGLVQPSGR